MDYITEWLASKMVGSFEENSIASQVAVGFLETDRTFR